MMEVKAILATLFLCFLSSVAPPVVAQTTGYTKLNVKERVRLEVPSDWTISDAEQRRRVKELSEELTGITHGSCGFAIGTVLSSTIAGDCPGVVHPDGVVSLSGRCSARGTSQ